jgi:osmoprotectant transport system permease protein
MTPYLLREIGDLVLDHVYLVLISTGIATLIGASAGILLAPRATPRNWVLATVNVIQTVPSLALFGFLIPLPALGGIGPRTAMVALVLYALLPVLRNTIAGLLGVDPAVRESAAAMGMTGAQRLWQVEIPMAAPVIFAGIRVAAVTTVGNTGIETLFFISLIIFQSDNPLYPCALVLG